MFEFLFGYWLGNSHCESTYETRYFKETPPRERTKEEKRKSAIRFIIIMIFAVTALLVYQDLLRTLQMIRFL